MSRDPEAGETPEQTLARLQQGSTGSGASVASAPGRPRYSPPLRMTRFREGYRVSDVDEFLDRAHRCTPEEVAAVKFRVVRLHASYAEDVVDALLEELADWLRDDSDIQREIASWSPPDHV